MIWSVDHDIVYSCLIPIGYEIKVLFHCYDYNLPTSNYTAGYKVPRCLSLYMSYIFPKWIHLIISNNNDITSAENLVPVNHGVAFIIPIIIPNIISQFSSNWEILSVPSGLSLHLYTTTCTIYVFNWTFLVPNHNPRLEILILPVKRP